MSINSSYVAYVFIAIPILISWRKIFEKRSREGECMEREIALDSRKRGRSAEINYAAAKRVQRRIGKNIARKNPNFKIDTERRIAELSRQMERLEELTKKSEEDQKNTSRLLAASAARLGWPADGTSLSPSREWPKDVSILSLVSDEKAAWSKDQTILSHLNLIAMDKNAGDILSNIQSQKANVIKLKNLSENQLSTYFAKK